MTKARVLADFISDGSPLADGQISVAEVVGAAPLASPDFTGTTTLAGASTTADITFGDNDKAIFGAGSDLEIYSDGNSSFIKENSATGSLFIDGNYVEIRRPDGGAANAKFFDGGAVELYHNNAKKIETTAIGISVTGSISIAGTEVISDDKRILNNESLPTVRPSLLLDFANSKTLDPRITFTRGSTATYWDGHTTTKAEENLITYSQDFSTIWTFGPSGAAGTITNNNATAPDGTTTAALIQATATTSQHYLQRPSSYYSPVSGQTYTLSCYLKAGTVDDVQFVFGNGADFGSATYINVDLTAGTITHTASSISASSITDVGNGWYRVTMSAPAIGSNNQGNFITSFVNPSSPTTRLASFTTAGTETYYIWGFQVEQRSSATAYTATTSSPIVKYQPVLQTAASGAARFDHAPLTGESKGLLIEEARTNLATHSKMNESLGNISRGTVFANSIIAPDGTQTANIYRENTANGAHHIQETIPNETANTVHTASVYLKNYGVSDVALKMRISDSGDVYKQVFFDLDNIVVSFSGDAGYTGTITDVGNGWRRCTITGDVGDGTNDLRVHVFSCQGTGTVSSYTGNGWDGLGFWGLQVEVGSFPTSYIATAGSTATRAQDDAEITDISFVNPTELTVYFESEQCANDQWRRYFAFGNNTNGPMEYAIFSSPTGYMTSMVKINGVTQASFASGGQIAEGVSIRGAMSIVEGKVALSINGVAAGTDTTVNLAGVNLTRLRIGRGEENYSQRFADKPIKKLAVYPKALSDATLQAMTEE